MEIKTLQELNKIFGRARAKRGKKIIYKSYLLQHYFTVDCATIQWENNLRYNNFHFSARKALIQIDFTTAKRKFAQRCFLLSDIVVRDVVVHTLLILELFMHNLTFYSLCTLSHFRLFKPC